MNFKEATNIMNAMAFVTCQFYHPAKTVGYAEESDWENYTNTINEMVKNFFEAYCEINNIKEIEE